MSFSKHIKKILCAVTAASALGAVPIAGTVARAAEPNEGLPGDWLSRYASPRAAGMGGASVAVGDEPVSSLWNPASLSWLSQNELQVGTVRLFDDTSINGLGFARPSRSIPSLGFNLLSLKSGEFRRTNELNEDLGTFDEGNMVMALTVAQPLSTRWSVGANAKLVRQSLEEFSGSGFGFDLGLMGQLTSALRVGASALNVGGPTITMRQKDESYATELRAGAALTLLGGKSLTSLDVVQRSDPGANLRAGTEFWVQNLVVRVGYYIDNIGAGFGYRLDNGLQLDYAATDHELGMVHRFGLTYRFAGFRAETRANPEVFSPTGQNPVTKFLITASTRADAADWDLEIRDRSGEVARRYAGQGQPPAHVIWDGKNEAGLPLPDGVYSYRLTVRDKEGRSLASPERQVEISTGGPRGSVGTQ
jgi:hypothetical protein